MTEQPFIALALALVVESAHWFRLRWDFSQQAYIRAWQISILAAGAVGFFLWLDGDRLTVLHSIIGWLPALFVPMQFTQAFGTKDSVPLSTFSFFARQRHLRNERLGLRDTSSRVNFGNIYFVVCLVAATLGPQATSLYFLPGLLLLLGWLLIASRQTRWLPLTIATAIVACGAIAGQTALSSLYQKAIRFQRGGDLGLNDPDAVDTAIGSLGEIKQSPQIKWRISTSPGSPVPPLLRSANFNRYSAGKWKNSEAYGFTDFLPIDEEPGGLDYYIFRSNEAIPDPPATLPVFDFRGSVESEAQLPLPGNTASIRGFALDGLRYNSLGTIRITPKNSIIRGTVAWRNTAQLEDPPMKEDGVIPYGENTTVRAIADELKLASLPTLEAKMNVIAKWFSNEFTYTRYLTISRQRTRDEPSAISTFLTENRNGHCEYFATAASLLLRAADVPTRYAIGYVVREKDGDGYVVRGTHAHAWVRAWDAKTSTWIDFDPTPGNWLSMEPTHQTSLQWLSDAYLKIREDFGLWRTDPANRTGLGIGMAIIGAVVLAFVGYRLWKSKKVVSSPSGKSRTRISPTIRTPLHELEPIAGRWLGPRPAGLPFSKWLLGLKPQLEEPAQLDEAIALHQHLRYDPASSDASVEPLKVLVERIQTHLKGRA